MKITPNSKCPCGSKLKYKKCCHIYHSGANANSALKLMITRYSAYATGDVGYIIRTTHHENQDFKADKTVWINEIDRFCRDTEFLGLEVLNFMDGTDEAFVEFRAKLSHGTLHEKSRFVMENGRWLYHSGEFF